MTQIVHRCLPESTLVFIHDDTVMAKFRQYHSENLVMLTLTVRVYENVILEVTNTFDVLEDRVHHTLYSEDADARPYGTLVCTFDLTVR